MDPVLVDSNVLLDIATSDPTWGHWSSRTLERVADEAILVINPLVYAEVSIGFAAIEDVEAALPADIYRREAQRRNAGASLFEGQVLEKNRGGREPATPSGTRLELGRGETGDERSARSHPDAGDRVVDEPPARERSAEAFPARLDLLSSAHRGGSYSICRPGRKVIFAQPPGHPGQAYFLWPRGNFCANLAT